MGQLLNAHGHTQLHSELAGSQAGKAVQQFDICQKVFLAWTDDTFTAGVQRVYSGITRDSPVPDDYAAWAKERARLCWEFRHVSFNVMQGSCRLVAASFLPNIMLSDWQEFSEQQIVLGGCRLAGESLYVNIMNE